MDDLGVLISEAATLAAEVDHLHRTGSSPAELAELAYELLGKTQAINRHIHSTITERSTT